MVFGDSRGPCDVIQKIRVKFPAILFKVTLGGPVCFANWVSKRHVREATASESLRSPKFKNLGHPAFLTDDIFVITEVRRIGYLSLERDAILRGDFQASERDSPVRRIVPKEAETTEHQ